MLSTTFLPLLKDLRANSVDLFEATHDEAPYQDLGYLQIQLFLSLVLKVLMLAIAYRLSGNLTLPYLLGYKMGFLSL